MISKECPKLMTKHLRNWMVIKKHRFTIDYIIINYKNSLNMVKPKLQMKIYHKLSNHKDCQNIAKKNLIQIQ